MLTHARSYLRASPQGSPIDFRFESIDRSRPQGSPIDFRFESIDRSSPKGSPIDFRFESIDRALRDPRSAFDSSRSIDRALRDPRSTFDSSRIFRLLQPFRAKTLIFTKKATFTSPAALARHHGSLLPGASQKHGIARESPLEAPEGIGVGPNRSLRAPKPLFSEPN